MKKALFAALALVVTVSQFGCDLGWSSLVQALSVGGDAGLDYTIQARVDVGELDYWQTLFTTNSPLLPFNWTDTNTTDFTQRFYRVLLGP